MIRTEPSITRSDMIRCALCADAPCEHVCEKVQPAGLLRRNFRIRIRACSVPHRASVHASGQVRCLCVTW